MAGAMQAEEDVSYSARRASRGTHRNALGALRDGGACLLVVAPLWIAGALAGCARVDDDQLRLCRIALPALEPAGSRIAVGRAEAADRGVRIAYRVTAADGAAREAVAECRFALGRPKEIEAIRTDRGEVPGATVYLLRRYYIDTPEGIAADPGAAAR